MGKPIIHLVCNAHLDPVWLWEWEEGACEAISTFRTAADLCEEFEGFVFNHNEAILYKWVEDRHVHLAHIYHNPFALRPLNPDLFPGVPQMVPGGKTMRWIDGEPE